tara:strand:+ start:382 stop:612 length:231 start_codon:yes stop_codon:yes gene_type:complete
MSMHQPEEPEDNQKELNQVAHLIQECIKKENVELIAKILIVMKTEYLELAYLATDGEYKEGWTHTDIMNFLTKGTL